MQTWIRMIRLQLGLTQDELSQELDGFDVKTIGNYETGARQIPLDYIAQLAVVAARELNGRPGTLPPAGMLRAACAFCSVEQARQVIELQTRRAA